MELLSSEFKHRIIDSLIEVVEKRQTIDHAFYKFYSISAVNCTKLRCRRTEGIMPDGDWLRLARKLDVNRIERKWKIARTDVFNIIEDDILFCKANSKAKVCVDECGIGKTFTAKYLAKTIPNCFYVDASQGKTVLMFTRILADAIGLQIGGKVQDIKEDIKCYLKMLDNPIVIIDEAGDLSPARLLEIKEFWNATEGYCGWYLMGADGLKYVIDRGIRLKKPGFKEIFSRFSERYTTTVPQGKEDRMQFYRKLITDVLTANMVEKGRINDIVRRCLVQYGDGSISGLRRAESLLILYKENDELTKQDYANTDGAGCHQEAESEAVVC